MDRQRIQLGAVGLGVPRFDQVEGEWGQASLVPVWVVLVWAVQDSGAAGLEVPRFDQAEAEWGPASVEPVYMMHYLSFVMYLCRS